MVLYITVLPEQCTTIKEIERKSFNNFLRDRIAPYLTDFEDCQETIIVLPYIITKVQRYNIHRLTVNGLISESYDDTEGNRIMRIIISKHFVEDLFRDYTFITQDIQVYPPIVKTEKQKLFEALLGFINENLLDEFDSYMSSI